MAQLQLTNQVPAEKTWQESIDIDLANLNPLSNWSIWRLTVKPSAVGQTLPSLPELAFDFFEQASLGRGGWEFNKETLDVNRRTVPHLLGLIHNSYLPSSSRPDRIGRGGWEFNKETLDVNRRTVPHLLGLIHNSYLPSSSSPDRIGRGGWEFNKETLDVNRRTVPHLLGLIQNSYLPSSSRPDPRGLEFIHCASALHETGIEFERDETGNPFDLKFEKGVFKIPPLRIHDSTVSFFQNLIAYEQRCHGSQQYITSYFLLLDRLIDTPSDVELLVQRQILENDFGGWEDVSTFFNSICKQIGLQDFYYAGLCVKVNEYYKTPWYKYKADFKRNHCKNPWTIISLVAGFALLSLTALQTVYSVLAYYK
ncbi:hypothetical protein OIU76_015910 [Salix suchowensis]|nr:hypothetical protein OIU76_015910 [Salix suchowensis]